MTPYRDHDWDDDRDEEEPGFDDDPDDSDDEPTVPCPFCRHEILEDSPYCPACERYISDEDRARAGKPAWVFVTALVCLGIAVWWVLAAF